jgi:hypothetical protein
MASSARMTRPTTNSRGGGPRRLQGRCAPGLKPVISSCTRALAASPEPLSPLFLPAGTAAYIQSAATGQPGLRSALPQLAAAAVTAAVPYPALARLCQR